ncbi:hypothetical protein SAMN04489751_2026 [Brevibacterium sandarakinum]|uniref:Secreted protein n=1 Tax=Brevibacterium sandarakinum TaxID=629680 RepID=A0A1H1SA95_BRESA|nr:hypothetical protein [Brevibacterium sandarakinum]SDS44239.1 hypothetical protein SAMN04489751_2026 [Brevibacterium sandarakinum]
MKSVRTFAVTALSAAVIAGGLSLAAATSASADPITGAVDQPGETASGPGQDQGDGTAVGIDDPDELSSEQIDNARTIIGVGKGAELSEKAQKIAVMTALQESSLQDLDGGDRDSAGAFQQRPSMKWGSLEQVTDPVFASKSFYGVNPDSPNPGLTQIDNWESIDPGEAAQDVQASAYPDEYAKWEPLAEQLVENNQDVDDID